MNFQKHADVFKSSSTVFYKTKNRSFFLGENDRSLQWKILYSYRSNGLNSI